MVAVVLLPRPKRRLVYRYVLILIIYSYALLQVPEHRVAVIFGDIIRLLLVQFVPLQSLLLLVVPPQPKRRLVHRYVPILFIYAYVLL